MGQPIKHQFKGRKTSWAEDLVQDFCFGLRTLTRDRSFTVITVLTLSLGIAVCTAIFSLVNAVLLRSLPYGEPSQLVYIFTPIVNVDLPVGVFGPSNADFADLKYQNLSFAEMTHCQQVIYNVGVDDHVERIGAAKVDADFFKTLQAQPEVGRQINITDERRGNDRVVVISYGLWRSMFGGRSDILGRTLRLNGAPYSVIGVMPADFQFPHRSDLAKGNGHIEATQLWLPSALTAQQRANREDFVGVAIARLKSGVTLQEAQAEMTTIMSHLDLLHPADLRGWSVHLKPFLDTAIGPARPLMRLLLGAVCFVLVIACANAASLFLARAAHRAHELSVRATLGAWRGRLIRQMLTESLILSAASGMVGIALVFPLLHALLKLDPGNIPRMQDAGVDARVLMFLVSVTVLTSILFGTLPSLSVTRIDLGEFLQAYGTRGTTGHRNRMRKGLATLQVALVVALLIGTGLLLRSYANVLYLQTGFSTSSVAMNLKLNPQYNLLQRRQNFFRTLLDRVKHTNNVQAAGVVNNLPLSNTEAIASFEVEGYPNEKNQLVEFRMITSGYLGAMQISLLNGRDFTDSDGPGHPAVAIVNQAFVNKYLGGSNPIGRHVRVGDDGPWGTVVGVIGDIRDAGLEDAPPAQMYIPFSQGDTQDGPAMSVYIAVRSSLPVDSLVSELRAEVQSIDPDLALAEVSTMNDRVSQARARRLFQTTLLALFSAMATALALVGIYGLLGHSVKQRTAEIGIRMALGSTRIAVARLILREGLTVTAAGTLFGLATALLCTRLIAGFLYGVPPIDPLTFLLVPALLILVTLAACLLPSWRASRIDPMDALRHE